MDGVEVWQGGGGERGGGFDGNWLYLLQRKAGNIKLTKITMGGKETRRERYVGKEDGEPNSPREEIRRSSELTYFLEVSSIVIS